MTIKKQPIIEGDVDTSSSITVVGNFDEYKDFKMDPKGYFLIRLNRNEGLIEAAHCTEINKVDVILKGKIPQDVYTEAVKRDLIGNLDHAAYFGKELEKAYIAMRRALKYVQDEDLVFNRD